MGPEEFMKLYDDLTQRITTDCLILSVHKKMNRFAEEAEFSIRVRFKKEASTNEPIVVAGGGP